LWRPVADARMLPLVIGEGLDAVETCSTGFTPRGTGGPLENPNSFGCSLKPGPGPDGGGC